MVKVIKIGGKILEDNAMLEYLCTGLSDCSPRCVVVHGGGSMAGQLASRLGIETRMHEGRRITDRDTLDVTVMAYAGLANKKLVAGLQAKGVNACGLSGCDMGVIRSYKRTAKEIDWGFVGDIEEVNAKVLADLIENKIMPVLSPITFDRHGQLLNTNADSVASAVAVALSRMYETELAFCMDKPGVLLDTMDNQSVIGELDREGYHTYLSRGIIHSGMIPKLDNAFKTIDAGVRCVRITNPYNLEGGTVIKGRKDPGGKTGTDRTGRNSSDTPE